MAELVDSIQVMSEGLNAINAHLGDLHPTTQEYKKLEVERDIAWDKYILLVKYFFKDSTKRFIEADSQLAEVTKEMQKALDDLQNFQNTLDNVRRFVTAIDTFITSVFV